jgi:hypothetical protein
LRSSSQARPDQHIEKAALVTVWLGAAEDDSSTAIEFLEKHWANVQQQVERELLETTSDLSNVPSWMNPYLEQELSTVSGLLQLFQRPYWRRIWIIQELTFARKIVLFCGRDCLEWNNLLGFLMAFERVLPLLMQDGFTSYHDDTGSYEDHIMESPAAKVVLGSSRWKTQCPPKKAEKLKYLLETYHMMESSLEVDGVFSLLGLVEDGSVKPELIKVDYNKPSSELFAEVWTAVYKNGLLNTYSGASEFFRMLRSALPVDDTDESIILIRVWLKLQDQLSNASSTPTWETIGGKHVEANELNREAMALFAKYGWCERRWVEQETPVCGMIRAEMSTLREIPEVSK